MTPPFLEARGLCKSYGRPPRAVLRDLELELPRGGAWGLLGESGCGKSTLARLLLGLEAPDAGTILMEGQPLRRWRARHPGGMSVVFQDYTTSVPPQCSVEEILAEGFPPGGARPGAGDLHALMDRVSLPRALARKRPHELSGGQLQRVCIARAIAARPAFLVLDEAVSSLDTPAQARILELLRDIRGDMTYLFITHDIQAAVFLCERLLFLHQGRIAASPPREDLFRTTTPIVRDLLDNALVFEDGG